MKSVTKHYSNGEVTIVWKNELCIHSKICWKSESGLPDVFDPRERPWIRPEAATTDKIIEHVNKCPSGALTYFMNEKAAEAEKVEEIQTVAVENIIEVTSNGPLLVYGNVTIKDKNGNETKKNKVTALCRCGASANKPYCDGAHTKINFQG